jgi:protein O-GlcNAc transferase
MTMEPIFDADDVFDIALEHHQSGRLNEAETLYRQILEADPEHPGALYLLGGIAYQNGNYEFAFELVDKAIREEPNDPDALHLLGSIAFKLQRHALAVELIDRALALNPQYAQAHYSRADVLLVQGELDAAAAGYRQALSLNPQFAEAHCNLGNIHKMQGKLDDAIASYRQAIAQRPDLHLAHSSLGQIFQAQIKLEEAALYYRQALAIEPNNAEIQSNLGTTLQSQGKLQESIECYRCALAIRPDAAAIHANLGNALLQSGDSEAAIASYEHALALKPDFAELHTYVGAALKSQGRLHEAIAKYQMALSLRPDLSVGHSNLGNILLDLGRVDEAIASYHRALALKPDFAEVHSNLGRALQDQGRLDDAEACFKKAIAIKPDFVNAYTNALVCAQYGADYSPAQLLADHMAFAQQFEAPLRALWPTHEQRRQATPTPLKIGFVSGDLKQHPVGFFLENALAHIDRSALAITLYATNDENDALTQRLRAMNNRWNSLGGLSDDQAAQRIQADGIDILVDLSGHTSHNRLMVFARKPAPVQATWLGYWATTGLQAIDYILCDRYGIAANEAQYFVEQPWYLPNTRLCFSPPLDDIAVAALPALSAGHITFGCFNNLTKMNDAVVMLWSQILHGVSGSRLLLKAKPLADPATRQTVLARFAAHGIGAERLLLEAHSSRADYLAAYHKVDIALDPFPFTGATTTIEGLWMGVPLVTRRGERMVARQGEGILSNIGLADWIAGDDAGYVATAIEKANNLHGLAELRERLLTSPLCDGRSFARNLEEAFHGMWEKYRNQPGG